MSARSLVRFLFPVIILSASSTCRLPQNPVNFPAAQLWEPNGAVLCSAVYGQRIYIAGEFSYLGPHTGCGQAVSRNGQQLVDGYGSLYEVNDRIHTAIADGQGGWYIGGDFTKIGSETRNHIAHLRADGSPYPWNPGADGCVYSLVLSGDLLYAGGEFTAMGGQPRGKVAALDASTGAVTAWDPNVYSASGADAHVYCLAADGATVYIGGKFQNAGEEARNGLAAVDVTTGAVLEWDPNPMWNATTPGSIHDLHLEADTLFVTGLFKSIGGQIRGWLAGVSTETGLATAMDADATYSGEVRSVLARDGVLYLGGNGLIIDGQQAGNLVALDAATGEVLRSYACTRVISKLLLFGDGLYLAGGGVAVIDTKSELIGNLDIRANGILRAVAVAGDRMYVGGEFTSIGGISCGSLAALDLASSGPPLWSVETTNGCAFSIAATESAVYIGGGFTEVSGQPRNRIAALDRATGAITSWDPNADGSVIALAVHDDVCYAGGEFANIGGQPRKQVAALQLSTGQATAWNPSVEDGYVTSLSIGDEVVYAAGAFNSIGGALRRGIAAIALASGAVTSWNPAPDDPPGTLLCVGERVYVGGVFATIGGASRNGLACLSARTGLATHWDPRSNGASCFAVEGGTLFIGGVSSFNGIPRGGLAAMSLTSGSLLSCNPNCAGLLAVLTIGAKGDAVYIGGNFSTIDGGNRRFFAAVDRETGHLLD